MMIDKNNLELVRDDDAEDEEIVECEEEECPCKSIRWDYIMASALIGGLISGFACFVYNHVLSERQRRDLCDAAVKQAKPLAKNMASKMIFGDED